MKEKISGRQATYLAISVLLGTVFLPLSQALALSAGRDGWMVVLPAYLAAYPFVPLALYIHLKAPGSDLNLLEKAKKILTPWLGYPFAGFFCLVSLLFTGSLIRQGGELFVRSLMIETPLWVFVGGEILFIVFIVYSGLEPFARFNEILTGPVLLSLVFLIIFTFQRAELGYLKPFLYNGLGPLTKGFTAIFPWGLEYVFFLFILFPYLGKPHEIKRSSLRAMAIIGLLLTAIVVIEFCTFSPEESERLFYGSLSLARIAQVGRIIQGLEPFFIVFWFAANILKAAAFFFCTYNSLRAVINFKHGLLKVTGVGLAVFGAAYIPANSIDLVQTLNLLDKYGILPLSTCGIGLLAAVTYIRSKKGKT